MNRKLDFILDSPYKSYNSSAAVGGILFAGDNYKIFAPYYYSNHLLLVSNENQALAIADDIWYQNDCMDFHYYATDMISPEEIISLLCDKIEEGYYISGQLDEIDIPYSWAYGRKHFHHDIFIYGYDSEQQIFYTAAYDKSGYFALHELDYHLVGNALWKPLSTFLQGSRILFFKPKLPSKPYSLNLTLIKQRLQEMLENTYEFAEAFPGWIYGLDCYNRVCGLLRGEIETKCSVTNASFSCLVEHKRMMIHRLQQFNENGVEIEPGILEEYYKLETACLKSLHVFLKYQINQIPVVLERLICGLQSIEEREGAVLRRLVKYL